MMEIARTAPSGMTTKTIGPFLALAFGLTWGLAAFWAGLILGIIWATWHIPAFLLSGTPQSAWSFGPFFTGVVAICIILTPMFNAARGSLLLAVLFHFQLNNPLWPDAQPRDTLIFVVVAVIVVLLNRRNMFHRGDGVTAVLMPGDRREPLPGQDRNISTPPWKLLDH